MQIICFTISSYTYYNLCALNPPTQCTLSLVRGSHINYLASLHRLVDSVGFCFKDRCDDKFTFL